MNTEKIVRLEKLLDRKLSDAEIERLRRIKSTLEIADNDALWDILIAMEYQRTFYETLPEKIAGASADIFRELTSSAEKEVALAQSRLAEGVVEQAKQLATRIDHASWFGLGMLMLAVLLLHGGLLLWAGYCIGSGQTQPPAFLLQMPVGVIAGSLCVAGGVLFGAAAAREYSEGHVGWQKRMLTALACLLSGVGVLILSI